MMRKELRDKILKRSKECREIYKDRGFYTMGDITSVVKEAIFKQVLEALSGEKQCSEIDGSLSVGYFHINDNWIQSSKKINKEKKRKQRSFL